LPDSGCCRLVQTSKYCLILGVAGYPAHPLLAQLTVISGSRTDVPATSTATNYAPYDAVWAKYMPFRGLINVSIHLGSESQNSNFYECMGIGISSLNVFSYIRKDSMDYNAHLVKMCTPAKHAGGTKKNLKSGSYRGSNLQKLLRRAKPSGSKGKT
jgi:hypothetical protein